MSTSEYLCVQSEWLLTKYFIHMKSTCRVVHLFKVITLYLLVCDRVDCRFEHITDLQYTSYLVM